MLLKRDWRLFWKNVRYVNINNNKCDLFDCIMVVILKKSFEIGEICYYLYLLKKKEMLV